jgi:adenylate cyclase
MLQVIRKKFLTGAMVGLATGILVWLLTQYVFDQFFFRIESQTYDWRLRRVVEPPKSPIEDIIIIDVDERSIQKLGSFYHWPREYWIKLLGYLSNAGVKMVGLDFIFDPNPRHPEDDRAFQQAITDAGMVCLAFYFSPADPDHYRTPMVNEPDNLDYQKLILEVPEELFAKIISQDRFEPTYPDFINASSSAGFVTMFPDPDGILRRIPLLLRFNQHVYASFSLQIAMQLKQIEQLSYDEQHSQLLLVDQAGKTVRIPIDRFGQMLIDYKGPFKSFRYISFYDVLMGFVQPAMLKDKTVLVGSSLTALFDLRSTPLQAAFPGVEVNANIVHQIVDEKFIQQLSAWQTFLLIVLFGTFAGLILIFPRPIGSIIITALFVILTLAAGLIILEQFALWLPLIPLLLSVVIAFAITYVYRYLFEERDKRQIRKIFSHYVSTSVVDELLKNPEKVQLGGEKKFCTVLFSDIVGFTTMAESMEPEKLVHLLNDYLTSMTNVILKHKGMLDKYEGDAIMAVFGAPVEIKESPELACYAGLEMQKQLKILREFWKKTGRPPIEMRIGINSGDMIVGNMGSETRFDYTVVGDAVNLASRLESANGVYDTRVIIGEQTFDKVQKRFVTRPLDLLRVKGKKNPVRAYELIAKSDEKLTEEFQQMIMAYKRGFKEYLLKNWESGIQYFEKAHQLKKDDGPTQLYLERCREFSIAPPAADWDGVYVMKSK